MSTSQLNQNGHTLVELMVAMGLFSLVLLATTQGTLWGAKESSLVQERERLQSFEISERLKFTQDKVVRSLAAKSGDDLLQECLSQPCRIECLKQEDWRPIDWGRIQRQMIQDEDMNWIDLGTHFVSLNGDWKPCPILMKDGVPLAPYFSPECATFARARWKSGGGDTLLVQLEVGNKLHRIQRRVSYRVPIAKDPITGTCRKTAGVSCGNGPVFLTKVNFAKGDFECSYLPQEASP